MHNIQRQTTIEEYVGRVFIRLTTIEEDLSRICSIGDEEIQTRRKAIQENLPSKNVDFNWNTFDPTSRKFIFREKRIIQKVANIFNSKNTIAIHVPNPSILHVR
ncbi:hypothetical protein Tco_1325884 [Tanacetum coccineum]